MKIKTIEIPSWTQIKKIGVQHEIQSERKFHDFMHGNVMLALGYLKGSLSLAPSPKVLRTIHGLLFGNILPSWGAFRENADEIRNGRALLCPEHEIEPRLCANARPLIQFPHIKNPLRAAARCYARLLAIQPFPDVADGQLINRTVADTVFTAQTEWLVEQCPKYCVKELISRARHAAPPRT
jgi:hypothetical protein